ncbi:MAG TPA: AAA family ATPase [Prosthecobacter sp.]|nr:AAA family ATPase [Prosthecobacter sp.]HRK14321.1 AAA family ATPase [Prosthecobacter sp.]
MSRLRNLYTYLITNNAAEVDRGWLADYIEFTSEVEKVRASLKLQLDIRDKSTYAGTRFELTSDPWAAFAEHLLYKKANGISSRGQSVLSDDNFQLFIAEPNFVAALAELIRDPSRENFSKYWEVWEATRQKHRAKANPLLINRTVAACTTKVTSTVNVPDFDRVYRWLVGEGILERLSDPNAGWYDRNVQVMEMLRAAFAEELEIGETSEQLLSMFVWYLFENIENISNPFTLKKQVIKYGAPGTGKTYTAMQSTKLFFDIWRDKYPNIAPELTHLQCIKVVQFHPSYGYEDFIEGLRPELRNGQPQLALQNGVFKEFCRRAGTWEIEVHGIPSAGPQLAADWQGLTVGDLKPHIGKELKHPSWDGIGTLGDSEKVADAVPPFFFIIDEINRAELSRVLGELMFAIEYRGVKGRISTQYAQLNTKETAMLTTGAEFWFFIPHNVYIIGTMNTIDRSVESFDLALRRRFRWERADPDIDAVRLHLQKRDAEPGNGSHPWAGLADDLAQLNERIRKEEILGADYEIGHAYLMNLRYPPTLTHTEVRRSVWGDSIRPLLEEYLRGSGRAETLIPEFQKAFGF